jgi:hypothetical protein
MRWSVRCLAAAAFALAAMTLTAHLPVSAEAVAVPGDFKVKLTSAARGPVRSPPDIESIEIDASGAAASSAMDGPEGRLPAAKLKLSRDAVARIHRAILDQRFFDLKPEYSNPSVLQGDQAQIVVTAGGRTRRVRTVNIRVHAFDRITIAIDRELPIERRIQYNALHTDSYRAVER